jgi:anaerobic selenocysteine-containing dehydrogenase
LPPEIQEKRLGSEYPLRQIGFGSNAHEDAILVAMETNKPYPIKMIWYQTTNPIANTAGEAPRVYAAMKDVEFNVVVDLYMTPTAVACADIVLPAAYSSERWGNRNWYTPMRSITKVADNYYESKSDEDIILDMGHRLNPELFPWKDNKDWYDWIMLNEATASGMTYDELIEKVYSYPDFQYRKYEKGLLRDDGEPGFNTYTGKLELKIELYEQWGLDPLPWYEEPPESPYSTPELFEEYPFVMTCGNRSYEFFHSEHRQLKLNREFHPDPIMDMNAEVAARLGIAAGDWVWIENRRGRFKQRARLDSFMDPRVIRAEHGWWFPEAEGAEPSLFGVFDSNCNNLTNMCVNGPTGYGAPYKCQIAKVYKATEENSQVPPTEQVTKLGGFAYVRK